jgi:hypothetical protein
VGVELRSTININKPAVLFLQNFKVRMEAQHFILPLSLHDSLGKTLPLPLPLLLTKSCMQRLSEHIVKHLSSNIVI